MNILEFTSMIWFGSLVAGFLGSLTGLGGGVVIVPFLTLIFGVDIRYAIGASLVSVIATSSGAAAAYVKEGFTNIRIGMFLEIATTMGALFGAALAAKVSTGIIAVIFGIVLIYSAYLSSRPKLYGTGDDHPDRLATLLRMDGSYPSLKGPVRYRVHAIPGGFSLMFIAGVLSGLLGIGSGAVKVLAMDQIMRIPRELSAFLVTAALLVSPSIAASAEPPGSANTTPAAPSTEPAPSKEPTAPAEADQYAAREASDGSAAEFEGGHSAVYISGGAVTLVLIIVILVILL